MATNKKRYSQFLCNKTGIPARVFIILFFLPFLRKRGWEANIISQLRKSKRCILKQQMSAFFFPSVQKHCYFIENETKYDPQVNHMKMQLVAFLEHTTRSAQYFTPSSNPSLLIGNVYWALHVDPTPHQVITRPIKLTLPSKPCITKPIKSTFNTTNRRKFL